MCLALYEIIYVNLIFHIWHSRSQNPWYPWNLIQVWPYWAWELPVIKCIPLRLWSLSSWDHTHWLVLYWKRKALINISHSHKFWIEENQRQFPSNNKNMLETWSKLQILQKNTYLLSPIVFLLSKKLTTTSLSFLFLQMELNCTLLSYNF